MVTAGDVRALLDDRPELAPAVESVLAADEPFTFDDVAVDSGQFGELVSRGVVEKTAGGDYRVADREALRRGLDAATDADSTGGAAAGSARGTGRGGRSGATATATAGLDRLFPGGFGASLPSRSEFSRGDRLAAACLLAGLVLVVAFRLTSWPAVFRGGHVVLSANDPYYYRVIVERLAADPAVTPSSLPSVAAKGEPLMVVTLWLATTLLGGASAVGDVLAWYPVVSAVLTALLVYPVAALVTDDRRVALAAVLMLAVLPGHAMRTSLGFADHHAFDYPWLVLTLLGLVLVAAAARRGTGASAGGSGTNSRPRFDLAVPRLDLAAAGVVAVAVGVTGQVLAWEAGPLLVVPVGLYVALDGIRAVAADESPLGTGGPVVLGVVVAAAVTWAVHVAMNWHTTLVAAAPALLAVGCLGVVVAAEATRRAGLPAWALGVAEVLGLVGGAALLRTAWPEFWLRLTASVTERLLAYRAIAEVRSLFSESLDWLLLFGFLLVVALPYLAWSFNRAREDARWLPLSVYGAYFLALATVQVRFVGQLSPIVAIFAGLAFVHLAAWVDVGDPPAPLAGGESPALSLPDRETVQALVLLFVLVAGLSVVQVPLKTNLITTESGQYDAAMDVAAYSEAEGLEYPENYVLSAWGDNRMYNYFVSGEAASYSFAQSNYREFVASTNGSAWYDRLDRRGFVVTTDDVLGNPEAAAAAGPNGTARTSPTIGVRLHSHYGSRSANASGLGHYRLVGTADNGSYKAFALVPGAVIEGSAGPNATVTVETEVTVEGTTFTYTRETTADANGTYRVRVAYPGTYSVGDGSAGTEVRVDESAVENGSTVAAGSADG